MKCRIIAVLASSMLLLTSCSNNSYSLLKDQESTQTAIQEDVTTTTEDSKTSEASEKATEENEGLKTQKTNENLLLEMSSDEREEVNVFLSNFSEVYYSPSADNLNDAEEKIQFAYLHALINASDLIIFIDEYMGISATNVDNILNRFFGSTVPHETPQNSQGWIYEDGNFLKPAATGESYQDFSIATEMTKRQDGNYDVAFNVYCDSTAYPSISDKSVYSLTNSEAAEKYEFSYSATAVLKAKKYNGSDTYELVSYNEE